MNVVSLVKDERNPEVLRIVNEGDYTLTGLEKQFGISQYLLKTYYGAESRGRGRPKKTRPFSEPKRRGRPPKDKAVSPPVEEITPYANETNALAPKTPSKEITLPRRPEPRRSFETFLIGLGFLLVAVIAQAIGGFINWKYGYSFGGDDPIISFACGMIGLVVDAGAFLFLPAGRMLWRKEYYFLSPVAFASWPLFLAGSTYAALGFVGVHVGDAIQARKAPSTQRELLTAQLERTVKLRNAIIEIGDQKMLENLMNDALGAVPTRNRRWSNDCTERTISFDYCANYIRLKGAWTQAKSRDDDDALIASLTARISALPNVGAANPAGEQLAQMTDGRINPEQASNYQIRWLGIVPGFSSIMLTIGLALCRRT